MTARLSGSTPYHERLTFVWIAYGSHGEPRAAFVIDGRAYADAEQARTAIGEALDQTGRRVQIADHRTARIRENDTELDYWPDWAEFRRLLDVYGPVYPWRRRSATPAVPAPVPVTVPQTPLYSGRYFDCWGQLVVTFPAGQGPRDPVLGRRAQGYGLNDHTGEFEADTRRAVQCAGGFEDDETWPLRDEDEFVAAVEERREELLRTSFYQRHDKPEIAAAYEGARSPRVTYEMWRQVHRRRAYFRAGTEPVRVDLTDDGTPETAWRLDATSGRIVPSGRTDAETVVAGRHERITEHGWLLAVEDRRRTLDVDGPIAEVYAKAAAEPDEVYRREILTRGFDLWAEKFASEG
jgi:hypothetical protein